MQDIEELKKKVLQPKLDASKEAARLSEENIKAEKRLKADPVEKKVVAERKKKLEKEVPQAEGDKSGIKVSYFWLKRFIILAYCRIAPVIYHQSPSYPPYPTRH